MPHHCLTVLMVQGCGQDKVNQELGASIPVEGQVDALNRLLQRSRIQLFNVNNKLVYKEIAVEDAVK